jgi:hypothetical protein
MSTPKHAMAVQDFRIKVLERLREASVQAGLATPHGEDAALHRLDAILTDLENIVHEAIYPEAQEKLDHEVRLAHTRQRLRETGIDELLMQCDRWNGQLTSMLAHRSPPILMSGTVRIVVRKLMNLLDRLPRETIVIAAEQAESSDLDGVMRAIRDARIGQ